MGLAGPGELTPEGVRELLLEVFPESVVAGADEVPAVLYTLRSLVAFLRDVSAISPAAAADLASEVERVAPEFAAAVAAADTAERQVAGEVVAGLRRADGVALDGHGGGQAWRRV